MNEIGKKLFFSLRVLKNFMRSGGGIRQRIRPRRPARGWYFCDRCHMSRKTLQSDIIKGTFTSLKSERRAANDIHYVGLYEHLDDLD